MSEILKAATFAAYKHRDQRRRDQAASPYINHPLAVANVLANEVEGISESYRESVVAALLHDTIEDTQTTTAELEANFGSLVTRIVQEVTDDKSLPKKERKRLQIEHAASLSHQAKLVKLADKICNLRDMANSPPHDWPVTRRVEYFDWCKAVVDGLRGCHAGLEALFDQAYAMRPASI